MSAIHGKGFLEARAKVDRDREYEPADAVQLVKSLGRAKFDESVEVHIRTGLNVRHADEQLRGTIALPNGLGKEVKIIVFAQGDKAREAEEAGVKGDRRFEVIHLDAGELDLHASMVRRIGAACQRWEAIRSWRAASSRRCHS